MSLESVAAQAVQFWELMQRAQKAKDRAKPLPARYPGGRDLAVIENAPGSYVLGR